MCDDYNTNHLNEAKAASPSGGFGWGPTGSSQREMAKTVRSSPLPFSRHAVRRDFEETTIRQGELQDCLRLLEEATPLPPAEMLVLMGRLRKLGYSV